MKGRITGCSGWISSSVGPLSFPLGPQDDVCSRNVLIPSVQLYAYERGCPGRYPRRRTCSADHKYSQSGIYYAPLKGGLVEYQQYVDALPVSDSPEVFGMHVNADVVSKVRARPTPAHCSTLR